MPERNPHACGRQFGVSEEEKSYICTLPINRPTAAASLPNYDTDDTDDTDDLLLLLLVIFIIPFVNLKMKNNC